MAKEIKDMLPIMQKMVDEGLDIALGNVSRIRISSTEDGRLKGVQELTVMIKDAGRYVYEDELIPILFFLNKNQYLKLENHE